MPGRPAAPQRTLAGWTPEDGDQSEWLASWVAEGWRPEYAWSGTVVVINGREVTRYAMIRDEDDLLPERRRSRPTDPLKEPPGTALKVLTSFRPGRYSWGLSPKLLRAFWPLALTESNDSPGRILLT
jgi:hypothetical protein